MVQPLWLAYALDIPLCDTQQHVHMDAATVFVSSFNSLFHLRIAVGS